MKKIKLLASLVGLSGLSMGLIPVITGCSCNKSSNVELDESVTKQGITIKSSNIQKDKESTIELNLPSGKSISTITLEIGNATLSKSDVTIDGGKITIPAAKMSVAKVTIKSITLTDASETLTASLDLTALTAAGITTSLPTTVKSDSASLIFDATATATKTGKFRFKYEATAEKGTKVETEDVNLSTTKKEGITANLKDIFDVMKDAGQTTGTVYVSFVKQTTKADFKAKLDEWVLTDSTSFAKYSKQYPVTQINFESEGEHKTITDIEYSLFKQNDNTYRQCVLKLDEEVGGSKEFAVAATSMTSAAYDSYLKEATTGITYEVNDEFISYVDNATAAETPNTLYSISFNKYGYLTSRKVYYSSSSQEDVEITYLESGAPTINSKTLAYGNDEYSLANVINVNCGDGQEINESNYTIIVPVQSLVSDKEVTITLKTNDGATTITSVDYTTDTSVEDETVTITLTPAQYAALSQTNTYKFEIAEKS